MPPLTDWNSKKFEWGNYSHPIKSSWRTLGRGGGGSGGAMANSGARPDTGALGSKCWVEGVGGGGAAQATKTPMTPLDTVQRSTEPTRAMRQTVN